MLSLKYHPKYKSCCKLTSLYNTCVFHIQNSCAQSRQYLTVGVQLALCNTVNNQNSQSLGNCLSCLIPPFTKYNQYACFHSSAMLPVDKRLIRHLLPNKHLLLPMLIKVTCWFQIILNHILFVCLLNFCLVIIRFWVRKFRLLFENAMFHVFCFILVRPHIKLQYCLNTKAHTSKRV